MFQRLFSAIGDTERRIEILPESVYSETIVAMSIRALDRDNEQHVCILDTLAQGGRIYLTNDGRITGSVFGSSGAVFRELEVVGEA